MSKYRAQLESWLKHLEIKADKVVDVGGQQKPVKDRVKTWDVKRYEILDLPDFDLESIFSGEGKDGHADIVFCLEVFEYLIDPVMAMRNIFLLLRPWSGKAYITFPLVYPTHNEIERDSLRYTERAIYRLAEAAGLNVANITYRKDQSGKLQEFYAADGMKAARGYDHRIYGFIAELTRGA